MIRTKGEAGTGKFQPLTRVLVYCHELLLGNVVEAVRHARSIRREINLARSLSQTELYGYAKELGVPLDLLKKTAELGRLPVVNFAAGGLGWLIL